MADKWPSSGARHRRPTFYPGSSMRDTIIRLATRGRCGRAPSTEPGSAASARPPELRRWARRGVLPPLKQLVARRAKSPASGTRRHGRSPPRMSRWTEEPSATATRTNLPLSTTEILGQAKYVISEKRRRGRVNDPSSGGGAWPRQRAVIAPFEKQRGSAPDAPRSLTR